MRLSSDEPCRYGAETFRGKHHMDPIEPVAPSGSRVWRVVQFPLTLIVIGLLLWIAAEVIGYSIAFYVFGVPLTGMATSLIASVMVAGLVMGTYWLFVRWVERRRVSELSAAGWWRELGAGLLLGLVVFSLVVAVIAAFGGYRIVGTRGLGVLPPVLALAIVSGVTEEIMARGILFRLVESWLGSWVALLLSAAFFGAAHLPNDNATPLAAFAIAIEAGVMLAAIYMVTRRLWAAIGLHAAWNFAQGGIYGIAISGMATDGLLVPRMQGPDLLTGGPFGAEASLPGMIVGTLVGVALLVVAHRRGRFVAPRWVRRRAVRTPG